MKHARLVTLTWILWFAFAHPALASTKEWSYAIPPGFGVTEVVADDIGGAAVGFSDGSTGFLVWLDSKGRTIYQRQLSGPQTGAIMGVNNRALVIELDDAGVVVVDRNARESTIPGVSLRVGGNPITPTDRNGFFAVELSNGVPVALVRYSY